MWRGGGNNSSETENASTGEVKAKAPRVCSCNLSRKAQSGGGGDYCTSNKRREGRFEWQHVTRMGLESGQAWWTVADAAGDKPRNTSVSATFPLRMNQLYGNKRLNVPCRARPAAPFPRRSYLCTVPRYLRRLRSAPTSPPAIRTAAGT